MTDTSTDPSLASWLQLHEELAQLVAHDMRNPLQAIIANASFLDDPFHPSEQETRETVADIRSSADVLLRLIDNAVAIARLEAPSGAATPRSAVSLLSAAESAVARCAQSAAGAEVVLALEAGDSARVMADPQLLELMIQNMVTNALQHSRRRNSVTVRVDREAGRSAVAVIDQGPAFGTHAQHFTREAQLAIKFQPDGRYSRGLGLYLIGLVSRAFDGTIETSRDGTRSVLRVWFPAAR